MKAGVVAAPEQIEIQEISIPRPGMYQALVEVLVCGFCNGTDAKIVQGTWPGVGPFPYILGHETVGRVLEVGRNVRHLKPGDHVLQARVEGEPWRKLGTAWGGFVEYALATDWRALLEDGEPLPNEFFRTQETIPADLDPLDAVMLISYKETYSALHHFGLKSGQPTLICGDGPVGLMLTLFAARMGAEPLIVSGHHDDRLERAWRLGASHTINSSQRPLEDFVHQVAPEGMALVIDAVGNPRIWQTGLNLLSDSGKVGVYGYSTQRRADLSWDRAPMRWSLEYLVVPPLDKMLAVHESLVAWIQAGELKAEDLVTDFLPLVDLQTIYQRVRDRQAFKAVAKIKS